MKNVLIVDIRNVYGNELVYPINETAKRFCQLTKSKTLNRSTIDIIKSMGYSIKVQEWALGTSGKAWKETSI